MKLFFFLLLPALAFSAVWPDDFGAFKRTSLNQAPGGDRALWREFGFQEAEEAEYAAGGKTFRARAYRFQDSTGAMAAFQAQRPADAKPSSLMLLAVESPNETLFAHGNYLFHFQGYKPNGDELAPMFETLPKLEQSPLPNLVELLPEDHYVANSGRFILGPHSLEQFEPRIPPSTAAFHMGTEAQAGAYRTDAGEMRLLVFSYPTPQIAMERVSEFQKIDGALVKRTGPLVAVMVSPPDPNAAERVLSQVRYEAVITWSEYVPTQRDNIGDLVINVFILIGIIVLLFAVAGLGVAALRVLLRKARKGEEPEAMIVLHLSDRR